MSFVKLDTRVLDSSLWLDRAAREVFITGLLMAGPQEFASPMPQIEVDCNKATGFAAPAGWYGFIPAAGPGIIHRACVGFDEGIEALRRLGNPDDASGSQPFEGRRMIRIDGGYLILNFMKYRDRDHSAAQRMRRLRERKKALRSNDRHVRPNVTHSREQIAEADNKEKPKSKACALRAPARVFTPPSLADVTVYCRERSNSVDPQKWLDHYQANGWKVGRNAMKDWRASVRTWERNDNQHPADVVLVTPVLSKSPTYNIPPGLDAESGEAAWNSAKEMLSNRINRHSYETWLQPLKPAGLRDGLLYLTLPSKDFSHVHSKFGAVISDALNGLQVEYLIPEERA